MRELSTGGHKLRRPSFSKTLSELPEVEEPEYTEEPLCPTFDVTSLNVLSPIGDEEILPSPRPRVNTMPEPITERLKGSDDVKPFNTGVAHRHTFPLKTKNVQKLAAELTDPYTTRMAKRRESNDMALGRSSYSGLKSPDPRFRRHSFPIPPMKQSRKGFVSPRLRINPNQNTNNMRTSTDSIENADSVAESRTSDSNPEDSLKNHSIRRNKASEDDRGSDVFGSFENLKSIVPEFYHKNKRRYSMPLDPTWKRRWSNPAFGHTNKRVDILLKYGKDIRNKYNNIPTENNSPQLKTIRTLADFMIEIPKKPRFSSFMSPEAQYSLMKGYEDKLYRKLSESVPAYDSLLKRNKTPNKNIDIKQKNTLGFLDDSDDEQVDDEKDTVVNEPRKTTSSFLTQTEEDSAFHSDNGNHYGGSPSFKQGPSSIVTDSHSVCSESQAADSDPKSVLRSIRRLSISLGKGGSINKHFHDEEDEEDICSNFTTRQRSYSLPAMPIDRRLMMSYRLQNAMDILDNISSEGEITLSPRLKVKRGANLSEYNVWVKEWNKEFCIKHRNDVKDSLDG